MSNKTADRYFYGLDIVRFSAALFVAIFHIGFWAGLPFSTSSRVIRGEVSYPEISWFACAGWVGVEIFFVLSGFVIAGSVQARSPWNFLKGRFMRIYPAVWICAPMSFLIWIIVDKDDFANQLHRLVQTMLLAPMELMPWGWVDGVYWTLMYETAFYFLVFVAMNMRRYISLSSLASFMALASGVYIGLLCFIYFGYSRPAFMDIFLRHNYIFLTIFQLRYGCLFAMGIMMWYWASGNMTIWRCLVLGLATISSIGEIFIHAHEFISVIPRSLIYHARLPIGIWLVVMIMMSLMIKFKVNEDLLGAYGKRFIRSFGLMTYPFYLLHSVVGAFILYCEVRIGIEKWVALAICFSVTGLISFSVYRFVEPQIRHFCNSCMISIFGAFRKMVG